MKIHKISFENFPKEVVYPTVLAEADNFIIKLAETKAELEKTLKLRYTVFNIEQGKGLQQSENTGLDIDIYDEHCLQIIVVNKETNNPVATYRAHLGLIATSAKGFYASNEYNLTGIDKIASNSIEVGRSCVLPEYRTGTAVSLLWTGLGIITARSKLQYLFGCVSMENNSPAISWALYEHFKNNDKISKIITATPHVGYDLEPSSQDEIDRYLVNIRQTIKDQVPPLFKGYLRLGTKICGPPIYDSEFGTIDFLILVDIFAMPERYARHFIKLS